jgi:hypothetical protein
VEWPSHGESEIAALGRIAVRVRIEHRGADVRTITIERAERSAGG